MRKGVRNGGEGVRGAQGCTCISNWPETLYKGATQSSYFVAMAATDLGEKGMELDGGREEGRCGGDGVFQLNAELAVVVVEAEAHRRGLL